MSPKKKILIERLYLRLHTFLILGTTTLVGWISSNLLLRAGWQLILTRYLVATTISYFCFLILTRLWLSYAAEKLAQDLLTHKALEGAQASRAEVREIRTSNRKEKKDGLFSWWDLADFSLEAEFAPFIATFIFLATLFLGFTFVFEMPSLLAELVLQGVLTSSLLKTSRKMDNPDWVGTLFKASIFPFIMILLSTLVIGVYFNSRCPGAVKLSEVIQNHCPNKQ